MDTAEGSKSILDEGTSPSILQDITMNQTSLFPMTETDSQILSDSNSHNESFIICGSEMSASLTESDDDFTGEMDIRGATGLTMKEYDDNLKKYTAENFQLRLKMYFLDERIAKMEGIQDKDIIRENVNLKVDNEQKAQEVERQSKLLAQALEALEQMQSEHQQEINQLNAKHEDQIMAMQVRIASLEAQIRFLEDCPETHLEDQNPLILTNHKKYLDSVAKIHELETLNAELKTKLLNYEEDVKIAQNIEKDKTSLLQQIKSYQDQLAAVEHQEIAVRNDATAQITEKLEAELAERTAELAALQAAHDRACDTIKSFVRRVLDERNDNKRLEADLDQARLVIESLETRLQQMDDLNNHTFSQRSCQCGVKETLERIKELEAEVMVLRCKPAVNDQQLLEKECEIEQIKTDLKKRTRYLQELVNKELWDKNRQIEKLEKKVLDLGEQLVKHEERVAPFQEDFFLLTKRLEELAGFLDSLITDRSLIQYNGETYRAIKRAIENSRELSRRLTMSFDGTLKLSHNEEISAVHSEDDYSMERRESEPLALKAKESEKQWLELDMPELSDEEKPVTGIRKKVERFCSKALGGNKGEMDASESEAWSEPDRSVSLARMGHIDSTSVTPLRLSKCKNSSSGSSEETLNETGLRSSAKRNRIGDAEVRKLQMKAKILEETNKDLKAKLLLLENKHVILSKLHGPAAPQLFLEVQECFKELDEARDHCQRLKQELATANGDLAVARQDLAAKEQICVEQKDAIAEITGKADEIVLEYELRLIELTKQKETADKRARDFETTLARAEKMRIDLEKQLVEINRKLTDSQNWQDKSKAQVKEAERHLDSCEKLLHDRADSERKMRELQEFVECLQRDLDGKQSEVDSWVERNKLQHGELTELKRRLFETERSKMVVEGKVKEEGERIKWMEGKLRELEQAMDQCEQETQAKILEEVRRRVDVQMMEVKKDWVSRVDLEKTRKNLQEVEERLKKTEEVFKEREDHLVKKLNRIETEKRDWMRQMNDLRLRSSEMDVELTRLAKEKIRLEDELRNATEKNSEIVRNHERAEATIRNLQKQTDYESNASGYTIPSAYFLSSRNLNSSPDLGIESDQGRFSSLEHQDKHTPRVGSYCNRLEAENEELRQQLEKLGLSLEETVAELASANYQKKQMERAICNQLHKTHHMLKNTRRNFELQDSGSGNDRQ